MSAAPREPTREILQQRSNRTGPFQHQSEKIALVLEDYTQYYQSLQDQLDDLRATGKTRILQILDPNQRDKFEKIMSDLAPQLENSNSK